MLRRWVLTRGREDISSARIFPSPLQRGWETPFSVLNVGVGTKPDRDGLKPDRETEKNRISISWSCNWLVTGALQAIIGSSPQDTALLESNRSGVLRQRGFCLRAVR